MSEIKRVDKTRHPASPSQEWCKVSLQVVAIGEILWDLLPSGRQLGGAPANFACHARALGAKVQLVTRVGNDDLGQEILRALEEMGLRSGTIAIDPTAATGTAGVQLNAAGQAQFLIQPDSAWDHLTAEPSALSAVATADVVYFGTLGQRSEKSRRAYRELLSAAVDSLRVCDVNLRQDFYSADLIVESLESANVFKLNEDELPILTRLLDLPASPTDFLSEIASRFDLAAVALTCGARGSMLYARGQLSTHTGRKSVLVRDTVGAGDAFTAAMTMGLLADWELEQINDFANEVAAEVCSHPGAMPPLPEHLQKRLKTTVR